MFSYSLAGVIMLVLLGIYSYTNLDKNKSVGWLVGNIVWLVVFGLLAATHVGWYFGVGLVAAVVETVISLASGVSPFSNFMVYVEGVLKNVFFFPVHVFEQVYGLLKNKI